MDIGENYSLAEMSVRLQDRLPDDFNYHGTPNPEGLLAIGEEATDDIGYEAVGGVGVAADLLRWAEETPRLSPEQKTGLVRDLNNPATAAGAMRSLRGWYDQAQQEALSTRTLAAGGYGSAAEVAAGFARAGSDPSYAAEHERRIAATPMEFVQF